MKRSDSRSKFRQVIKLKLRRSSKAEMQSRLVFLFRRFVFISDVGVRSRVCPSLIELQSIFCSPRQHDIDLCSDSERLLGCALRMRNALLRTNASFIPAVHLSWKSSRSQRRPRVEKEAARPVASGGPHNAERKVRGWKAKTEGPKQTDRQAHRLPALSHTALGRITAETSRNFLAVFTYSAV